MREVKNENIIKLHEVFETENSIYLILDLLEGGCLFENREKFNGKLEI